MVSDRPDNLFLPGQHRWSPRASLPVRDPLVVAPRDRVGALFVTLCNRARGRPTAGTPGMPNCGQETPGTATLSGHPDPIRPQLPVDHSLTGSLTCDDEGAGNFPNAPTVRL